MKIFFGLRLIVFLWNRGSSVRAFRRLASGQTSALGSEVQCSCRGAAGLGSDVGGCNGACPPIAPWESKGQACELVPVRASVKRRGQCWDYNRQLSPFIANSEAEHSARADPYPYHQSVPQHCTAQRFCHRCLCSDVSEEMLAHIVEWAFQLDRGAGVFWR